MSKKLYEGMFLVDPAQAASDWDKVEKNIRSILERGEVEIVSIRKWDTRNLAYEIDGHSRGTYVLSYFRADGEKNADIERTVQLSEQIIRVLILCADHISEQDIEKDTPATLVEKNKQKAAHAAAEKAEEKQAPEESKEPGQSEEQHEPEPAAADADSERPDEKEIDSEQVDEQQEGEPERDKGRLDAQKEAEGEEVSE